MNADPQPWLLSVSPSQSKCALCTVLHVSDRTVLPCREHVKGTDIESDWIDALVVGLDFLKAQSDDRKFAALKIDLFSELGSK